MTPGNAEPDERTSRLGALREALVGQDFNADLDTDFHLRVSSQWTPGIEVSVSCRRRTIADVAELWFWTSEGRPIAPADENHIMDAITKIKGLAASRL